MRSPPVGVRGAVTQVKCVLRVFTCVIFFFANTVAWYCGGRTECSEARTLGIIYSAKAEETEVIDGY